MNKIDIKEEVIYRDKLDMNRSIILVEGEIDGYKFEIISMGSHPNCYIWLKENSKFKDKHYNDIDLDIHQGLTYKEGLKIGWDYAHLGDYYHCLHFSPEFNKFQENNKKWTVTELIEEVKAAIKHLEVLEYGN